MAAATYFVPGLTRAQREALDRCGAGDDVLPGVHPKTLARLRELGLIVCCGQRVLGRDRFGPITVNSYSMPPAVHLAWCQWCSTLPEEED
jgi:hypothetical protein